jgi:hypothetical protein
MPVVGYTGPNSIGSINAGCGQAYGLQAADCQINLIQNTVYTLTPTQVLTMFTTPVVIIPAPGAGLTIIPYLTVLKIPYAGTAYAGGGVVTISYVGGSAIGPTYTAGQINVSASTTYSSGVTNSTSTAATINAGIQITNATGVFTTGNSPITIDILYVIV